MHYKQIERLIRAVRYLATRHTGLTLDELAQAFEVDKRTASRLRDAIGALYDLHHASTDENGRKPASKPCRAAGYDRRCLAGHDR